MLSFSRSSFSTPIRAALIQLVDQLDQCDLENSAQKQGKSLHQFPDMETGCRKDHSQLISQAVAQLMAILPVFTFTMSDHRFNG